ncbi:hypothetical protein DdX_11192 [Ditylenchus destructor]|uniref:Uncharacterized protein n=1 Tax=Ditylenchus destructor TaxID=166010 RepID=A0AAD4MYU6_9BILA|nr:hypothetical protein DdX_11192 [Ditylenchus destructor]
MFTVSSPAPSWLEDDVAANLTTNPVVDENDTFHHATNSLNSDRLCFWLLIMIAIFLLLISLTLNGFLLLRNRKLQHRLDKLDGIPGKDFNKKVERSKIQVW